MQESPKVYVVVLNFNGWTDTIECLQSLRQIHYRNFQTVIVDNGSIDGSVGHLKSWLSENGAVGSPIQTVSRMFEDQKPGNVQVSMFDWPQLGTDGNQKDSTWPIVLVESDENLGFSGGNNLGVRFGISRNDAEYFWLLNNDTVVDSRALDEMVLTFMERDSNDRPLAMCGSLILDFDQRDQVQAFGGGKVNRILGTTHNLLSGEDSQASTVADATVLPDYISGCSLLIKSERIAMTGLLNEEYFLYWEDTEWSFRCKRRGMRLAVAKQSKVWHRRGSTSGRFPVIAFYNTRNCLWFFRDYLRAYLPLCLIFRPLHFSAVALKHLNYPFFRESMRGYLAFFKTRGAT
jgi:GT2 family glycosyltransferase